MSRKRATIIICIMTAVLAALFTPALAFADGQGFVPGYHDIKKDVYKVPGGRRDLALSSLATQYPAVYDSRAQKWFRGIKVRDQGETALCWAAATTAAAEISYAKETYGTGVQVKELSPVQLGYFFYNRVNDPLGNTAGDANKTRGEKNWIDIGGLSVLVMQHLATWSGIGPEENTPFVLNDDLTIDSSLSLDAKYAYDNCITLENSIYCPDAAKETLKSLIREYGAVTASLYYNRYFFDNGDRDNNSYYMPEIYSHYSGNHTVAVIGWDDTYSRKNFASYDYETKGFTVQPENDGAWIVQDSYGTGKHDGGYFYVSYDSIGITGSDAVAYDMQPAKAYDFNYQYDGSSYPGDTYTQKLDIYSGHKAANVFTAKGDIYLKAVGITEYNEGPVSYTIDVYKGITDPADPESGKHVSSTECTTETAGCKTIRLSKPVVIGKGTSYSIVITFHTDNTRFGLETNAFYEWCNIETAASAGQSFCFADGVWTDIGKTRTQNFRIKGFADRIKKNPMTAKGKTVPVSYSAVRKKSLKIKRSKAIKVSGAKTKITYKLLSVAKSKFKKYFRVSSKTGKITVKKGLKKGKYRLKVRVSAAGGSGYYAKTKKVTITVKVR